MDEQLRKLAYEAGIGDDDVLWVKSFNQYDVGDYDGPKDFEWPNVILEDIE